MAKHSALAVALLTCVGVLAGCASTYDGPQSDAGSTPVPSSTQATVSSPDAIAQPSPSGVPSASPSPTASAEQFALTGWPYGEVLALDAVVELTVKGRAPKTGYDRDLFGVGWVDIDRNGCDTRNDVLAVQMAQVLKAGRCKVTDGVLADPYTGTDIAFEPGSRSPVHIDHVVALSDAWQKGAQGWEWEKRVAFANDPLNLLAVDASTNMSKGDGDAATWLPPSTVFRCEYVSRQVAVKVKYGIWATAAEQEAMTRVLGTCPGQKLPAPGDQSTTASNTGGDEPGSAEAPSDESDAVAAEGSDEDYGTCKAAKAAGRGPYREGVDPEYSYYRDADGDGVVCE